MAKKFKGATAAAVASAAVRVLQDEHLRAQLIDAGHAAADKAKAWRATQRRPQLGPGPGAPARPSRPSRPSRLPQVSLPAVSSHQRLVVRVERLADAVALLNRHGTAPTAGGVHTVPAFDGIDEAIERLRVAVAVSEKLPRDKRKEMEAQVGAHLNELETSVQAATLGGG